MIEIKNLSFSYKKSPYIDSMNLSLEEGRLIAIIGTNGSGKSTLLKLISGELSPRQGEITVNGKNAKKIRRREMARLVSYFPQGRETPDMTALEMVSLGRFATRAMGISPSKKERAIAMSALDYVGMANFANVNLKKMSYGEKQKVSLAMLVAQDAQHCLVDEPTNFLDIGAQFAMMETLRSLRNKGKCIICVLHDIPLAMKYADRVIIMQNGTVFADGTPDELYENKLINETFGISLVKNQDNDQTSYIAIPKTQF